MLNPPATPTINAFGAQGTPGDKRPKGGKTQGKRKGGGKTPDAKDEKDGTDKFGGKTKLEGDYFNCGKYGHRKSDCMSKAKTEAKPPTNTRYTRTSQPQGEADKHVSFFSTFGSMPDDGDEEHDDHTRRSH
jgi:hypothetical protein